MRTAISPRLAMSNFLNMNPAAERACILALQQQFTQAWECAGHGKSSGEIVVDLTVTRNGRRYPFKWVVEDGMPRTFTNEDAAGSSEMPEQIAPLHTWFSDFH